MRTLLLICILFPLLSQAQQYGVLIKSTVTIPALVHKPKASGKQPLIIVLHGIGERTSTSDTTKLYLLKKNGITKIVETGDITAKTPSGVTKNFYVISPQLKSSYGSWPTYYVRDVLAWAKKNLSIDTTMIYLTGLSLGGGGCWTVANDATLIRNFAAIAPVCGTCALKQPGNFKKYNVGVWAAHAYDDTRVSFSCSNNAIKAIKSYGVDAWWTPYLTGGHGIWGRFYAVKKIAYPLYPSGNSVTTPNLYTWFLRYHR